MSLCSVIVFSTVEGLHSNNYNLLLENSMSQR